MSSLASSPLLRHLRPPHRLLSAPEVAEADPDSEDRMEDGGRPEAGCRFRCRAFPSPISRHVLERERSREADREGQRELFPAM